MINTTNRRETELPLSQPDIAAAFQLLNQEQYELLAQLLDNFQTHAIEEGISASECELLAMMRSLALSCHLYNKSAVWHQQVGEQAFNQQEETAAVLRDFLHALEDNGEDKSLHHNNLALKQLPAQGAQHTNGDEQPNLWGRIKSLLQTSDTGVIVPPMSTAANGNHKQPTTQATDEAVSLPDDEPYGEEPTLLIYGLGVFCAYYQGQLISDWASRKSKAVFKYLLLNRDKPVPKEILMEVFWPDSDETAARNNLNVTIYNLRQVFGKIDSGKSYVLYQDDCYLINPDLHIWFDYDVFRKHYIKGSKFSKQAQPEAAVREFRAAELVYRGELFEEDRYEDWLLPQREATHNHYVRVLEHLIQHAFEQQQYIECINLCHKLLTVDACLEDTHRLLIRCYMQQGQNHLAIRQYYTCVQTLEDELGVLPSQDTVALYEQIRTTMTKGG